MQPQKSKIIAAAASAWLIVPQLAAIVAIAVLMGVLTPKPQKTKMVRAAAEPRIEIPEAALYLGASQRQVRRWVQQGRLPHTKLGLRVQFTEAQLDAFVEANTFTPSGLDTVRRHGVGEVAAYFNVPVVTVRGWVEQGLLVADCPTGASRFSLEALGEFSRNNPDAF